MSATIHDRHWKVLLEAIESGTCIPVLGPDLCVVGKDGSRRNLAIDLSRQLAEILLEDKQLKVDDPDNLGLIAQTFQNELSRDALILEMKTFYEAHADRSAQRGDATFECLASLPFPLFVTSRHDGTLSGYLEKQGKQPRTKTYHFHGGQETTLRDLGTAEQPVIYQLYGSFDDGSSLVVAEGDVLDFVRAVVAGDPGLPVDLLNLFRDQNLLFLGFGLGGYHLRVLLHVLNLSKSRMSFALENAPVTEGEQVFDHRFHESVVFYTSLGYNFLKLLDTKLETFIEELHRRWIARHPDGAAPPAPPPSPLPRSSDGPSVFISYVKEDQARAERLFERLREEGLNPWIDKDGLRSGERWSDTLEDTVSKHVDYFIVLQSRALGERKESYVYKEVSIALERQSRRAGRFIFPIQIDEEARRLESIERAKIQTGTLYDWNADVKALASEIRRDFEAR
jgi:hypothetical protein